MGLPWAGSHLVPSLAGVYILIAWYGSFKGASPNRDFLTVFLSPIVSFSLHWNYGIGVIRGNLRILTGRSGLQIDDRSRS